MQPCAVIGDIHGRLDLLNKMLKHLDHHISPSDHVILLGDYIDRGTESAAVLKDLYGRRNDGKFVTLMGNHEAMMMAFLQQPVAHGARWLRYGGLQTLASFEIAVTRSAPDDAELTRIAEQLKEALGADMIDWLTQLPKVWQTGNVAVVHAGADPDRPVATQPDQILLWGHDAFGKRARSDGIWVVHGHTIVDAPMSKNGVISLDTGAYATNRLSAAILSPGSCQFVTVQSD
ncbi:MAG: metallophosphoesterase [Paracoccaceae bacterium]